MKVTKLEFEGETYHLFYNTEAWLTLQEEFGNEIGKAINPTTKTGRDALCRAVEMLSEQGELTRRHYGYDAGPMLKADELKLLMRPWQVFNIYETALQALAAGYNREIEEESKEVDIVLQQLQKKTK